MKELLLIIVLLNVGCSPGQHSGYIRFIDPNTVEAQFDVPMTMSWERDGSKVEASSKKPGLFEDIFKFFFLKPR